MIELHNSITNPPIPVVKTYGIRAGRRRPERAFSLGQAEVKIVVIPILWLVTQIYLLQIHLPHGQFHHQRVQVDHQLSKVHTVKYTLTTFSYLLCTGDVCLIQTLPFAILSYMMGRDGTTWFARAIASWKKKNMGFVKLRHFLITYRVHTIYFWDHISLKLLAHTPLKSITFHL